MKRVGLAALFFAALFVGWELLYRSGFWSPVLLPSPLVVGAPSVAQRLLGAVGAVVVWSDGGRHVLCRRDGHAVVGHHCDR